MLHLSIIATVCNKTSWIHKINFIENKSKMFYYDFNYCVQ